MTYLHYWLFVRGIHMRPKGFPSQKDNDVESKSFLWSYDVIMVYNQSWDTLRLPYFQGNYAAQIQDSRYFLNKNLEK